MKDRFVYVFWDERHVVELLHLDDEIMHLKFLDERVGTI